MNEAPPRYDASAGDQTSCNSSNSSSEIAILQAQVIELQRQIARLSEAQQNTLLRQGIIPDPPVFNGKSWFREWYWKMIGKLEELQSFDEKTKIDYIVSRLTESAFLTVEDYLPQRLRPERNTTYRVIETAADLMHLIKRKYS